MKKGMMKDVKCYIDRPSVQAGLTLKNHKRPEANNMAFHTSIHKEYVIQNRSELAEKLHLTLDQFVCAEQTHSANCYYVTKQDRGRGAQDEQSAIPNTDALYTKETDIVLCTYTADCVPVYLYNERERIIGIIHSGWNGTVKEITPKTLTSISKRENCSINDFHVHIGMAISQKRFEVDEDVFLLFEELGYASPFIQYHKETNKYYIDNKQVIKKQCERIGIPTSQITIDPTCTFDSTDGFSYREDRQTGRHLGFIYQTNTE